MEFAFTIAYIEKNYGSYLKHRTSQWCGMISGKSKGRQAGSVSRACIS